MTLAIVLLAAGLIVGGGIGYFAAPTKSVTTTVTVKDLPLNGQTIKLGAIAASATELEVQTPFHNQQVAVDMNTYAALLGYDVTFQYLQDGCNEQDSIHLEKVQGYRSLGVTCFEGGGWSSQASASLNYVNTNSMLMWSYSSTSPTLSIANDRLFRMCPSDSYYTPALIDALWSYGIKDVILFYRADSWGDGIINLFTPAWTAKGGEFAGDKIRYAVETTEFSSYLQQANVQAEAAIAKWKDPQRVGLVLLCFDEGPVIVSQMDKFAALYSCVPFDGDGTAVSIRIMTDSPTQGNHLIFPSLMAASPESPKYNALKGKFEELTSQQWTAYRAFEYDVGFTFMGTMLQAQSSQADDIVDLQIPYCYQEYGAGGWCRLLDNGDRSPPPFDIWIFKPGADKPCVSVIAGRYDIDTLKTTWNTVVLGYTPLGP